jgi:hypothetical protein
LCQIIESERIRRRGSAAHVQPPIERHVFRSRVVAILQKDAQLLICPGESGASLPTFAVDDPKTPLHLVLQTHLQTMLNQTVEFDSSSDDRFDFVAPNHIGIHCQPPDVHLDFYYRCLMQFPEQVYAPGCEWRSIDSVNLPGHIGELVME